MKEPTKNPSSHEALIENLADLLNKGNAHVSLDKALSNIDFKILGKRPDGLPYSLWQLAEHIRIAQHDILEFSRDPKYVSPKWPEGYWPTETAPTSENEWHQCVQQIKKDRASFIDLITHAGESLYSPIAHGDGQTLLKEALVVADHNSYHTGEIILLRRLLHDWGEK